MGKAHRIWGRLPGALAVATVLAFSAVPSDAQAVVDFIYSVPGSQCQLTNSSTIAIYAGTIYTTSTTTDAALHCPLIHQSPTFQAYYKTWDQHPTINTSCTLTAAKSAGTTFAFDQETASTTGSDPSVKIVNFSGLPLSSGFEYLYADCTVPRNWSGYNSHLASFWIKQTG